MTEADARTMCQQCLGKMEHKESNTVNITRYMTVNRPKIQSPTSNYIHYRQVPRFGIFWLVKTHFNGRTIMSLLSIS